MLFCPSANRAENIVSFPAFQTDHRSAGQLDKFSAERHLNPQFIGHRRAGAFIILIHLVAEGRRVDIISSDDDIWSIAFDQLLIGFGKPEKCVGRCPIFGCQRAYRKK